MSTSSKTADSLRNANLRLCRLRLWTNYNGFGFNLESSSKPPYIIDFVEPYSPAAAGGLQALDVVLSIDNHDVSSADCYQVIDAIKQARDGNGLIELLVIQKSFYRSLIKKNIHFNVNFASIINTPQIMPIDYQNYFKYQPRSCEIYLNKSDERFGFDLSNDENEIGAYIKKIHPNTPASQSLLRQNDRIIEINDEYVDEKVRKSIYKRLDKAKLKGYVKLYIMDVDTYTHYQMNKIPLSSKYYRKNRNINRESFNYRSTSGSISSIVLDEDIRLCTIIRADATDTLGVTINYHARELLHSLSISSGRNNGPSNAKLSGINDDDCLIEINGKNIENLDHEQVKQCLFENKYPARIQMLVTDILTYNYYKQDNKRIHHRLSTVRVMPPNIPQESLSYVKYQSNNDDEDNFNQTLSYDRNLHSSTRRLSNNSNDTQSLSPEYHSHVPKRTAIYVRKKSYLPLRTNKNSRPSIYVCKGDLVTQQTDVIVVCSSSQYLFDSICKAGGCFVSDSYEMALKNNSKDSVIAVKASGKLESKQIYFLSWKADSDTKILRKSIEKFVSDAIKKAAQENYRSIAFPAIGCGRFGCSISLVAQAMIEEADRQLFMHSISVLFVIQTDRVDIYDEFQKQIQLLQSQQSDGGVESISTTVGEGVIEVEQGDITTQNVDVIIASSSSQRLRDTIISAAGYEVQNAYDIEYGNNANSILISTPSGALYCKRIFFLKWEPTADEEILQRSLIDLMSTVIQSMKSHNFTSIAFPAIGCGQHGCPVRIVVKTMVLGMKRQLVERNLPWTVKFVIQSDQPDIYDEFCKQVLTTHEDVMESQLNQVPSTWEKSTEYKIRFVLSTTSDEYKSIVSNFDQAMKGNYTRIIRIERIQNERWYMQYLAHSRDFKRRLNADTEKRLYHGCPERAANSIIEDCFNRSFAGVNGTVYGYGVYFSSNAVYSHKYTRTNANGERCMFLARVLVGKTTKGDSSMKTRPLGFDSTTDNNHIFVTYHDAQAFAEYLITYR